MRDHGRIDVLVNNAGFSVAGFGEDLALSDIRHQFETNFFGNVAMSKAVLPVMRRQKSGHIIQVTSVAGRVGTPLLSAYCSSKFALEGFSESLRIETHSLGIRVVLVEPGAFDTDIWTRNVIVAQGALDPNSPNKERSQRFTEFVKNKRQEPPRRPRSGPTHPADRQRSQPQAPLHDRRRRQNAGLAEAPCALERLRAHGRQGGEDRLSAIGEAVRYGSTAHTRAKSDRDGRWVCADF